MLARTFRLPSSVRFRTAQSLATPFFIIKIVANGLDVSRFGFLVSKKVDKRAVVRNRVKRKIRAGVESLLHEIQPGFDVLFIVRQGAVEQDTSTICTEIKRVFVRKGLVTTKNTV